MKSKLLTTQKIIQSAAELFLLRGFGNVSMDLIAEHADITKVTVYQHFESKEALLLLCLRWRLESREANLAAHFRDRPSSPENVLEIFNWMARKGAGGIFHGCAFIKATSEMANILPEVREMALQAKCLLRKRILSMLHEAGFRHANTLADTLALLLEGAQALSLVEQSVRPFKAAKREAQALLASHVPNRRLLTLRRLEA